MILLLIILFLFAGGFGFSPYNRFGYAGYSPLFLVIVVVVVLLLMGRI